MTALASIPSIKDGLFARISFCSSRLYVPIGPWHAKIVVKIIAVLIDVPVAERSENLKYLRTWTS